MKTILLIFLLILTASAYCQDTTLLVRANKTKIKDGYVPYVVGSNKIKGYAIEIRSCPLDEGVILENGRRIAGLSCIVTDKSQYVGGTLTFKKKETEILDMKVQTVGNEVRFVVTGKDFNMELTLSNGAILKMEDDVTTFFTKGKGIWSIAKK